MKLSPEHPDYPINSTHLFSTNIAIGQHNHDIFHKSTNEKIEIKAFGIVLGYLSDELKERFKIIWVLFREKHLGKDYRNEYSHLHNQTLNGHWGSSFRGPKTVQKAPNASSAQAISIRAMHLQLKLFIVVREIH